MPRPLAWWHPPCVRDRVILNLTDTPDEALQGILWSYRGGWLTLRDVSGLSTGQQPAKVDGEVIVHVSKVAYIQVLAP